MVISVQPRSRSKFNDLASLKVEHHKGSVETPNRLINRHDLNAKDGIGADISLTRTAKTFIIQDIINEEKLENVLYKNGYLGQVLSKTSALASRIDSSNALVFLYPSLTSEAARALNSTTKITDFVRFYCELARMIYLEALLLPVYGNVNEILRPLKKREMQLIPILDLKTNTSTLSKQYHECRSAESTDIPIIAFKFSTYKNANKGYDLVMDDLDKLHESNQATMIIDAQRFLPSSESLNVSAPHYGSFFMADFVAERYVGPAGRSINTEHERRRSVRVFCRKDLSLPMMDASLRDDNKFDVDAKLSVFENDKRLRDLLERIIGDSTKTEDWNYNKPFYLSRVHENIRTKEEFETFRKHIESDTASDYLRDKNDMNNVVSNHLKSRVLHV